MFDLCSDRLLENEERFAGRGGHRFVEIWDCGGRQPTYRSGELKEKEIASWVDEERSANGPVQSGLRVLLSPKASGKPSSGKLPFSRSTYHALSTSWRIPCLFLRAITQKLSVVTRCSVPSLQTQSNRSSPAIPDFPDHIRTECNSKISDDGICLLVRGDVDWTWDYTLLLTFDPKTHTTYVLITGLTAVEIDLVHSYLASLAFTSSPSLSTHPLLLPIVLLDLATDDTASLLKLRIKLLSQIQQRTGMDRFNSLKSATIEGRKSIGRKEIERRELDLDAVMLRLTCLSDWVAAQRGFVGLQRRVVSVVEDMLEESSGIGRPARLFRERLDFVTESLLAAEQKCLYLERSIGAQVQTIYSLIGQQDNRLNRSATSASCQIASDSRRIAILTRRDSTDMRIIAAVTLIFLPGTFVATVFSTGMFDWGHGDPTPTPNADNDGDGRGSLVSRYIWVYFMLTGILTAVVLVAWILFSWIQNRRMMRKFGFDVESGEELNELGDFETDKEGRDMETTLREQKAMGRRSWALREFERWKVEARGSLRWWKRKEHNEGLRVEELKSA